MNCLHDKIQLFNKSFVLFIIVSTKGYCEEIKVAELCEKSHSCCNFWVVGY